LAFESSQAKKEGSREAAHGTPSNAKQSAFGRVRQPTETEKERYDHAETLEKRPVREGRIAQAPLSHEASPQESPVPVHR
jgi:hypothetical protein